MVTGSSAQKSLDAVAEGGNYIGVAVSYGGIVTHHSMIVSGSGIIGEGDGAEGMVNVVFEISHDLKCWLGIDNARVMINSPGRPTGSGANISGGAWLFPAPYARARVVEWRCRAADATVTATIAGA